MANLYTGKGDGGTTKFFGCDQKRVSKSSAVAEALGNLDELNSFLGVVKVRSQDLGFRICDLGFEQVLQEVQESLFTICANIAGAEKSLGASKVEWSESIIAECEKELPPIKVFTIAGGSELSALYDYARTLARRAERRVVAVHDEQSSKQPDGTVSPEILQYLNRLSSLLFALARLTNHRSGIKESSPSYE